MAARAPGTLPYPDAFAFVGSGSVLVLELLAGRILAPTLGVSLYTWTSVIGVVLAGISVGNYVGGRLADRRPSRALLGALHLLGAISSGLIVVLANDFEAIAAPRTWPAMLQVLWLTTLVFFLPTARVTRSSGPTYRRSAASSRTSRS